MGNDQGGFSGSNEDHFQRPGPSSKGVRAEASSAANKASEDGLSKEESLKACQAEHSELLLCFHERASIFSMSCTEERKAFWSCYEKARGRDNVRLKYGLDKLVIKKADS